MIQTMSSMEFIDAALFEGDSFELSYKDPTQKLVIRDHSQKFFHDFPYFIPSTEEYVHFDGTTMNLLNVTGLLHVSNYLPEVPLIIWLHENYPFISPMVYILPNNESSAYENNSCIDPSGSVTPPYILNWNPRKSNLCDLVHNIVSLFQHNHPSMLDYALKATILDDLTTKICDDLAELDIKNRNEIERWSTEQAKLQEKGNALDGYVTRLVDERDCLEKRVVELREYNDKLFDWMTYSKQMGAMAHIEIVGDKSKMVDCRAADKALDDVLYSLDKAFEQGVIKLDVYMRQVRVFAREQYFERARLLKLKKTTSKS